MPLPCVKLLILSLKDEVPCNACDRVNVVKGNVYKRVFPPSFPGTVVVAVDDKMIGVEKDAPVALTTSNVTVGAGHPPAGE